MAVGETKLKTPKFILFVFLQLLLGVFSFSISNAQILNPQQVSEIKKLVLENIQAKSNHLTHTEFNGSFDWHSDVHGHWALLSMARVTQDQNLDLLMTKKLNFLRLKKEIQFLTAHENKNFELPYGRAWFLMLLMELSQRPVGGDPEFQKYRMLMTTRMIQYLAEASFPEAAWDNHFSGQHDSWLMSLFLTQLASRDLTSVQAQLQKLIEEKMLPQSDKYLLQSKSENDFLSLTALNSLILETPPETIEVPKLPKKNKFACHDPGYLQVITWPLSHDCSRGSAKSCESIKEFTLQFFEKTYLWKDNFDCVSHWVPQFMWMSHWLSLGQP